MPAEAPALGVVAPIRDGNAVEAVGEHWRRGEPLRKERPPIATVNRVSLGADEVWVDHVV